MRRSLSDGPSEKYKIQISFEFGMRRSQDLAEYKQRSLYGVQPQNQFPREWREERAGSEKGEGEGP